MVCSCCTWNLTYDDFLSFFLEMIVNPENSFKYLKNLQLNKGQEYKEAVQVKPQHVQLKLRTSKYYF